MAAMQADSPAPGQRSRPIRSRAASVLVGALLATLLVACGNDDETPIDSTVPVTAAEPAPTEAAEPVPTAASEPVPTEASEPASTEAGEPADTEGGHEVVDDRAVTSGFAKLTDEVTAYQSHITKGADLKAEFRELFETWESFEGTVKKNETDLYLSIEDALSALKRAGESGDQSAAATAFADYNKAVIAYLAKHP